MVDGDHVPVMPLVDTVGSAGAVLPLQIGGKAEKVLVATALRVIVTLLDEAQVPFRIDHLKTLLPTANPVTVVLGLVTDVIFPVPETNVHTPLLKGLVAAIVAVVVNAHKVWLGPAFATIGLASTVTEDEWVQPSATLVTVRVYVPTEPTTTVFLLGSPTMIPLVVVQA